VAFDWSSLPASEWLTVGSADKNNSRNQTLSADTVRGITQFLVSRGTFDFPTLDNGLFSAAAGEGGDFELTGYRNVWLRDNIQIAWAHLAVLNDPAIPLRCIQTLTEFYAAHRHRFADIIEGRADFNEPGNRPHIRFNGAELRENSEKWSHAQNDALGYFLWLTCELVKRNALTPATTDWTLIAQLVRFWMVIKVWQDEDSGHWEEVRKIAASSIGCALAGLSSLSELMDQPEIASQLAAAVHPISQQDVDTLIAHCRKALMQILPAECIQSDVTKNRRYDAALVFLIYPLNIIQDRVLEDQILNDVKSQLQGPYGIRRYPGDSYWCADYRDLLGAAERTADFSDNLDQRDQLLKPGMEAQWCIFDPIIACIHGQRFLADDNPKSLALQIESTARSLSQLTPAGARFPQYRCPESYFCEKGQWIPNDITPLLWTQANLWQALSLLERNLSLAGVQSRISGAGTNV
jgi:phosphorylase kinase alpha/beta subunit